MPEITGPVKAKSQYGVKMTDDGDWWNWSKPEYRGQPFDTSVVAGDTVHVEYTKADNGKIYISTIGKVVRGGPRAEEWEPDDFPPPEPAQTPPVPSQPTVSGKDILMAKMNAIKVAGELYAACITAGVYKELPTPETIKAYAEAIEAKV